MIALLARIGRLDRRQIETALASMVKDLDGVHPIIAGGFVVTCALALVLIAAMPS